MIFDLHVHSNLSSCSQMNPGEIIATAKLRGLDGVCITDHDTMEIRHHLREGIQENGVCVIFGVEYTTTRGDFLLFGPFEDLPPLLPAEKLLELVARKGGAVIGAHPFRRRRPLDGRLVDTGLCKAIEMINGRNTAAENRAAEQWRGYPGLSSCGGSDAHTLAELGCVVTRFTVPVRTRIDLIAAISNGNCRPERPSVPLPYAPSQTTHLEPVQAGTTTR